MPTGILAMGAKVSNIVQEKIHVVNTTESLSFNDLLELLNILLRYIIAYNKAKNKAIFIKTNRRFRYETREENGLSRITYTVKVILLSSNKVAGVTVGFKFSQRF